MPVAKTISIEVSDKLPETLASQIKDDARRAAIYRVAHQRKITFPEAAEFLGFSKQEADRLIEGMDWYEDPLAPELFEERMKEAEEERRTGEAHYWQPGDPVV